MSSISTTVAEADSNRLERPHPPQWPVEKIEGELVLRIPLEAGGDHLIDCSKGISRVDGEYLTIVIPEWLAGMLRIAEGCLLSVGNENGKFNIWPVNPASLQRLDGGSFLGNYQLAILNSQRGNSRRQFELFALLG